MAVYYNRTGGFRKVPDLFASTRKPTVARVAKKKGVMSQEVENESLTIQVGKNDSEKIQAVGQVN